MALLASTLESAKREARAVKCTLNSGMLGWIGIRGGTKLKG